jgi:GMP reductase
MDTVFDYEDIQLIPAKSIVNRRSECDTSVTFGGHTFKLPVVPANMQTIIDEKLAIFFAENGYFYIMHRFQPEKRLSFVKDMQARGLIASISVGVKEGEYDFVNQLADENLTPEFITIDIAHGHSNAVIEMIKHIKKQLPNSFVIAGNVGTPEAVRELEHAGADATKVGIGPGKVCITKIKTGFGTGGWQLAALRWCAKAASKPIIADGGIRTHGDIANLLDLVHQWSWLVLYLRDMKNLLGKQLRRTESILKNTSVRLQNSKKANEKMLKVKKCTWNTRGV